jgi:hypothetical protein
MSEHADNCAHTPPSALVAPRERQPDENARAFAAFPCYRDLPMHIRAAVLALVTAGRWGAPPVAGCLSDAAGSWPAQLPRQAPRTR